MKTDISVCILMVVVFTVFCHADEKHILSFADYVRKEAHYHREVFVKDGEVSFAPANDSGSVIFTNSFDGVSVVCTGMLRTVLSVEVLRTTGTNEVFRFSRDNGMVTKYETRDAKGAGIEMLFHTNGNLRCYAEIADGAFFGKRYQFDENGCLSDVSDVTGKPVFVIAPPCRTNAENHVENNKVFLDALQKL